MGRKNKGRNRGKNSGGNQQPDQKTKQVATHADIIAERVTDDLLKHGKATYVELGREVTMYAKPNAERIAEDQKTLAAIAVSLSELKIEAGQQEDDSQSVVTEEHYQQLLTLLNLVERYGNYVYGSKHFEQVDLEELQSCVALAKESFTALLMVVEDLPLQLQFMERDNEAERPQLLGKLFSANVSFGLFVNYLSNRPGEAEDKLSDEAQEELVSYLSFLGRMVELSSIYKDSLPEGFLGNSLGRFLLFIRDADEIYHAYEERVGKLQAGRVLSCCAEFCARMSVNQGIPLPLPSLMRSLSPTQEQPKNKKLTDLQDAVWLVESAKAAFDEAGEEATSDVEKEDSASSDEDSVEANTTTDFQRAAAYAELLVVCGIVFEALYSYQSARKEVDAQMTRVAAPLSPFPLLPASSLLPPAFSSVLGSGLGPSSALMPFGSPLSSLPVASIAAADAPLFFEMQKYKARIIAELQQLMEAGLLSSEERKDITEVQEYGEHYCTVYAGARGFPEGSQTLSRDDILSKKDWAQSMGFLLDYNSNNWNAYENGEIPHSRELLKFAIGPLHALKNTGMAMRRLFEKRSTLDPEMDQMLVVVSQAFLGLYQSPSYLQMALLSNMDIANTHKDFVKILTAAIGCEQVDSEVRDLLRDHLLRIQVTAVATVGKQTRKPQPLEEAYRVDAPSVVKHVLEQKQLPESVPIVVRSEASVRAGEYALFNGKELAQNFRSAKQCIAFSASLLSENDQRFAEMSKREQVEHYYNSILVLKTSALFLNAYIGTYFKTKNDKSKLVDDGDVEAFERTTLETHRTVMKVVESLQSRTFSDTHKGLLDNEPADAHREGKKFLQDASIETATFGFHFAMSQENQVDAKESLLSLYGCFKDKLANYKQLKKEQKPLLELQFYLNSLIENFSVFKSGVAEFKERFNAEPFANLDKVRSSCEGQLQKESHDFVRKAGQISQEQQRQQAAAKAEAEAKQRKEQQERERAEQKRRAAELRQRARDDARIKKEMEKKALSEMKEEPQSHRKGKGNGGDKKKKSKKQQQDRTVRANGAVAHVDESLSREEKVQKVDLLADLRDKNVAGLKTEELLADLKHVASVLHSKDAHEDKMLVKDCLEYVQKCYKTKAFRGLFVEQHYAGFEPLHQQFIKEANPQEQLDIFARYMSAAAYSELPARQLEKAATETIVKMQAQSPHLYLQTKANFFVSAVQFMVKLPIAGGEHDYSFTLENIQESLTLHVQPVLEGMSEPKKGFMKRCLEATTRFLENFHTYYAANGDVLPSHKIDKITGFADVLLEQSRHFPDDKDVKTLRESLEIQLEPFKPAEVKEKPEPQRPKRGQQSERKQVRKGKRAKGITRDKLVGGSLVTTSSKSTAVALSTTREIPQKPLSYIEHASDTPSSGPVNVWQQRIEEQKMKSAPEVSGSKEAGYYFYPYGTRHKDDGVLLHPSTVRIIRDALQAIKDQQAVPVIKDGSDGQYGWYYSKGEQGDHMLLAGETRTIVADALDRMKEFYCEKQVGVA